MARKRFKTVEYPSGIEFGWSTEARAYEYVNEARAAYRGGNHSVTAISVYEDGDLYEGLDFAGESS